MLQLLLTQRPLRYPGSLQCVQSLKPCSGLICFPLDRGQRFSLFMLLGRERAPFRLGSDGGRGGTSKEDPCFLKKNPGLGEKAHPVRVGARNWNLGPGRANECSIAQLSLQLPLFH